MPRQRFYIDDLHANLCTLELKLSDRFSCGEVLENQELHDFAGVFTNHVIELMSACDDTIRENIEGISMKVFKVIEWLEKLGMDTVKQSPTRVIQEIGEHVANTMRSIEELLGVLPESQIQ